MIIENVYQNIDFDYYRFNLDGVGQDFGTGRCMAQFHQGQLIELHNTGVWELIAPAGQNHWLAWRHRDSAVTILSWSGAEGWKIVKGREPWPAHK